jgi:hypothetical protein
MILRRKLFRNGTSKVITIPKQAIRRQGCKNGYIFLAVLNEDERRRYEDEWRLN